MDNIITIDGPAASGKGTLAKNLAAALNFAHLDTGAVYRLVALKVIDENLTPLEAVQDVSQNFDLNQTLNEALRRPDVSAKTSEIAALEEVRVMLDDLQRNFAENPPKPFIGAVLDGRDIGTHICPNAKLKLFITSSAEIRATRRFKELQLKGIPITYEAVLKEMMERDTRDQTRSFRPLRPATDAVIIDSTALTATEVLQKALSAAQEKLKL